VDYRLCGNDMGKGWGFVFCHPGSNLQEDELRRGSTAEIYRTWILAYAGMTEGNRE